MDSNPSSNPELNLIAKAFLHKNPDEQAITAARIYKLCPVTLWSSLIGLNLLV